ncbi:Low temperature requirement protein LtrA [Micromonospora peucetia]|uniref:Low temperature requirement protein LtrA n=1 Tax=Micromonospora peucetia TaxID=47871 RepID=A0A1C6V4Y6_9ACTN|nr:Low temperature requirement protein LtrA [Micromonospora peucetia]
MGTHRLAPAAPGAKVTRLELFYDLVFVFAFINVTNASAKTLGEGGLLGSLLVLALLWTAWTSLATLGNVVRADQGIMPLFGFTTMAVIFVASVSLPEAFTDKPPGLPGDLVFAGCYLVVRNLQLLAFWYALRNDPRLRPRWRTIAVPPFITVSLLLLAALVPQRLFDGDAEAVARVGLWVLAVAVAFAVSQRTRNEGLTIVSAGHWAERHAQIVLIALGESIISLGLGPGLEAGLPLTWPIIGASALGIAVIAALWWIYFDSRAIAGERALHRVHGPARIALARDAYTYLHLPIIAGTILFALGLKRVLAEIGDPTGVGLHERIDVLDAAVLYGGVALYLLAVLGFQFRTVHRVNRLQVLALVVLIALIPVGTALPSFGALTLLVVVIVLVAIIDTVRYRHKRQELRQEKFHEERELEAGETEWRRRYLEQQQTPREGHPPESAIVP